MLLQFILTNAIALKIELFNNVSKVLLILQNSHDYGCDWMQWTPASLCTFIHQSQEGGFLEEKLIYAWQCLVSTTYPPSSKASMARMRKQAFFLQTQTYMTVSSIHHLHPSSKASMARMRKGASLPTNSYITPPKGGPTEKQPLHITALPGICMVMYIWMLVQ